MHSSIVEECACIDQCAIIAPKNLLEDAGCTTITQWYCVVIVQCIISTVFSTGRFSASNDTDSVMMFQYDVDSGFQLLHADRYSRPVTHNCIVQQPKPSHGTAVAADRLGRVFFLAPEPESYSQESNMYTAAQYHMGQSAAGITPANLLQPSKAGGLDKQQQDAQSQSAVQDASSRDQSQQMSASSSALPDPSGQQSASAQLHQGAAILSQLHGDYTHQQGLYAQQQSVSSAQLHQEANLEATSPSGGCGGYPYTQQQSGPSTPSSVHQSSALTAALSASPQAHRQARRAQQQSSMEQSSWVSVTRAGDVIQISSITVDQYQLLAALQRAMLADAVTAPLSGCDLFQWRTDLRFHQARPQFQGELAAMARQDMLSHDSLWQCTDSCMEHKRLQLCVQQ